jgi:hypothetical protein
LLKKKHHRNYIHINYENNGYFKVLVDYIFDPGGNFELEFDPGIFLGLKILLVQLATFLTGSWDFVQLSLHLHMKMKDMKGFFLWF